MNQNILDHGAVGDGQTLSTSAIQKAIDTCAETGGGYVYVPQGRFVTGTILLKSNVYLFVCPGGALLGSMDFTDYLGTKRGSAWGGVVTFQLTRLNNPCQALIIAEDEENCGILGEGEIDGRRNRENAFDQQIGNPFLVVFSHCRGVKLDGITLRNPGMFTVYMLACVDVAITRVKIYSTGTACGDGIDFDGGRNVTISDCIIYSGDDSISLKALTPSEPCENFMIQNCYLHSKYWGCVRIGPESAADMRHITITNCVFEDSNDGFKVQLCENSVYEYFNFSNISMKGVVRPFFFTNNTYGMSENDTSVRPKSGIMRYINISNVTAEAIQRPKSPDPTDSSLLHLSCSYLYCLPGYAMHDIKFSNVHITCVGGGEASENNRADHGEMVDYTEFYPEICREVGVYPAAAMYIKNCDRISMENVSVRAKSYDARPAIAAEAVNELYLHHVTTEDTAYLLRNIECTDVNLSCCKGNLLPVSDELVAKWKENREYALNLLKAQEQDAALVDELGKLPVLAIIENTSGEFEAENSQRCFLFSPWMKGDFDLFINDQKVDSHRILPKYRYLTCYVKEITDFIKSGKNTMHIDFCSDDAKLAMPVRIITK